MLVFPQLPTGALTQFPAVKKRAARTIVNTAEDGSRVVLTDAAGASTVWELTYSGLSDTELNALAAFHATAEGSLNGFTWVDPTANLIEWSEQLTNAVWTLGPLLTATGGIADAMGGTAACLVTNGGAGAQTIAQTLNAPAGYVYSFSVYVRAAQATTVTLQVGASSATYAVGAAWSRVTLARAGDPNASAITFGIQIPAGAAVNVFGPQVEAQAAASKYKTSTTGGVYANARLLNDTFAFTTTGVNRHTVTLKIYYANHL